jgi:uncharacterized protein DUF6455
MSITSHARERSNVAGRLAQWWQGWRASRRTTRELGCCAREDVERMAHDVGVDRAELCILAGKWPDSADLLARRMGALKLDPADSGQVEPAVVRDLQRVCSLCASKRKCAHDLARHPSDPAWRDYCPNVATLDALMAARASGASGASGKAV